MNNLLYIYLGATLVLLGYIVPRTIARATIKIRELQNAKKARFCHHCEYSFIDVWEDAFQYCPYCGQKLKTINDTPDEEQQENPFKDFQQ